MDSLVVMKKATTKLHLSPANAGALPRPVGQRPGTRSADKLTAAPESTVSPNAAAQVVPHAGTRSGGTAPVASAPAAVLDAATAASVYGIADSLIELATKAERISDCKTWDDARKLLEQLQELLPLETERAYR